MERRNNSSGERKGAVKQKEREKKGQKKQRGGETKGAEKQKERKNKMRK